MMIMIMMMAAMLPCVRSEIKREGKTETKLPHIVFVLADDLGWHDTSIFGDQSNATVESTQTLKQLADEGVRLARHYVHWHCSPSRRTFLSGRNPLHHGEFLSNVDTDDLDLRWTWISEILSRKGYTNHWYGKGHTGYKSMNHLPARRGFHQSVLFLGGAGSYYTMPRWNDTRPFETKATDPHTYSTDLFGSLALAAVEDHDLDNGPLFLYLPWQAVHAPYDLPPYCQNDTKSCPNQIRSMISDVDGWMRKIVDALKRRDMYENTLLVFTSDNGGTQDPVNTSNPGGGNNYPLRGAKHSNWDGGMRSQTFVSGGFVPVDARGTTNSEFFHISDWYPTFCGIVGGRDCSDASPEKPLPIDPTDPSRDIYRGPNASCWPSVDGHDIWASITRNESLDRPFLWLSGQAMIKTDTGHKIVVAQQEPDVANSPPMSGWREADGSWTSGGDIDGKGCGLAFKDRSHFTPCLFDLRGDEREKTDLASSHPDLLQMLWSELNRTALTAYTSRSPAHLLGSCNEKCASMRWKGLYGAPFKGPMCGVTGCT